VELALHLRLFKLSRLIQPRAVPGHLRQAVRDDLELVRICYQAFMADADAQAGRAPGSSPQDGSDSESLLRRIDDGGIWLWVDRSGTAVHLTAVNTPSFGVARIGPVYTPPEQRGRGYASAAVAAVSGRLLEAGVVPCLFTDQANPTSNKIYTALGYEPVVDMANYVVRPIAASGVRPASASTAVASSFSSTLSVPRPQSTAAG
jgi:GNAT superfamily N-acetyltransferase